MVRSTRAHFQLHIAEAGAGRHGGGTRYWSMVSCPRCGGAVTVETAGPHDQSGRVLNVYPEAGADLRVEHLPEDVEGYYRDAIRVLEAGVPDAAAVQLRRTLEAAAAHHGIDSGPLVQRIKKLIDAGHITTDFGTVLDHIRQVGNVGAHATDEHVDEETARRALRFTTQVLRNLFEIPAELKALAGDDAPREPTS
jgi:hypothetical protein